MPFKRKQKSSPTKAESTQVPSAVGYYQSPCLQGDRLFFLCEGDIWYAPIQDAGDTFQATHAAVRLTTGLGSVSSLAACRTSKTLAFVSTQEGARDLYVVSAEGGVPKRVTYVESVSQVVGFKDDKTVLIASGHDSAFGREDSLYSVCLQTLQLTRLPFGLASFASFDKNLTFLGRHGYGYTSWKRYQGGMAGEIWRLEGDKKQERLFPDLAHNLLRPLVLKGRLYFISDHEGHGALYSSSLDGKDLKRHTDLDGFYVRQTSTDGRRICYKKGGAIFVFDPESGTNKPVAVQAPSPCEGRSRYFAAPETHLVGHQISPDGKNFLLITRGRAFVGACFKGPMIPLGKRHGVRYRLGGWCGKDLVALVCDQGEEEVVHVVNLQDLDIKELKGAWGRIVSFHTDVEGRFAIAANHTHALFEIDLKKGKTTPIESKTVDGYGGVSIAPGGRYVAYSYALSLELKVLKIWDRKEKKAHTLNTPVLGDMCPTFDPKGAYLYFLSYQTVHEELNRSKVCFYVLSSAAKDPLLHPGQAEDAEDEKKKPKKPETVIDWAGLQVRQFALPMPEGDFRKIQASMGKLFFLRAVDLEEKTSALAPAKPKGLHFGFFDVGALKEEVICPGILDMNLTAAGDWVSLVQVDKSIRLLRAGEKPDEEDRSYKAGGRFDYDRVSLEVLPEKEWAFMFSEAWRLQKDFFWDPDMGKVDWQGTRKRYGELLPLVRTTAELMDVVAEMQGDLGVSHAYTWGFDRGDGPLFKLGHLGASLSWSAKAGGAEITHIDDGDGRFPEKRSALCVAGETIQKGDVITAIDGQALAPDVPPQTLLVDKAAKSVLLSIKPKGKRKEKNVWVRPLKSVLPLRYAAFVEKNRSYVHDKSKGRVGYIFIPDMSAKGHQDFYKAYPHEFDKESLILDVRFNGGGNISTQLLSQLMRKRLGFDQSRHEGKIPYMFGAPQGPMVALCNGYTGSDGDIFSYSFQKLGLGPLIGTRTWGGVIGIWPKHPLLDGSWTSQPGYAPWFHDIGWRLENRGAEPDIQVDITPLDAMKGADPQLDRGIQEALAQIKKHAAA